MAIEKYKIIEKERISNSLFDNYYFILENSKNITLKYPVDFTVKYIHSRLECQEIPIDTALVVAEILPKYRDQEFIATKFSNPVTIDNGKNWIKPKIGETYKVFRTGFRVNYNQSVELKLNRDIVSDILDKAEWREFKKTITN